MTDVTSSLKICYCLINFLVKLYCPKQGYLLWYDDGDDDDDEDDGGSDDCFDYNNLII